MTLYILPNLLDPEGDKRTVYPAAIDDIIPKLDGLICENEKLARKYLKDFTFPEGKSFRDVELRLLNEHTSKEELFELMGPLARGETWGLISDAGLPCIADPGSNLVAAARKRGIEIISFPGPSSLILALQLSGLSGQAFHFHGYLPRKEEALISRLGELVTRSRKERATQSFIEAPYRNMKLLRLLLETLPSDALLTVATDLTMPSQKVVTGRVANFKCDDIHKKPTVFLFKLM